VGALASALLGAGEGVAAGAAVLDGASPLLGALFGDAFDGVTFVGPESVLITSGAVGGRPGSGTPVGAGAIALDGSIAVAGLGATIDGLAGAAVEAVSRVADISAAGVAVGGGGVSAGFGGSTTATVSLPSVLSIR